MRYPPSVREKVFLLHEQGMSANKIAREVHKHQSCVSRYLRTARGQPSTIKPSHKGRVRLFSLRDERILKRLVTSGMCDTASEISRNAAVLGLPATSANTIRRALRRQGLMARLKARMPALTKLHMRLRLEWARQHRHWTVGDWEKVIFSDETKLFCVNPSGRAWCWRPAGDHSLSDRVVRPTKKFGGISLMMWGCMSAKGGGRGGGRCMSHYDDYGLFRLH